MKKILIIILVLFIGMYMFYYMNKKEDNNIINNFEEDRYVFISYIDYRYLKGKDENILKEEINKMVLNIKENNFHAWLNENLAKGNLKIISMIEYTRKLIYDYYSIK